jgi:putative hydrolase of the HAD superfamily
MANVKHLFFDIGGVMLTNGWDHASRKAAATHFGLDWEEFRDRHDMVARDFDEGRMSLDDYLTRTVFYRPRAYSRDDYTQFVYAQSQPKDDVLSVVRLLATSGRYPMATINNESRELNDYRIRQFGLDRMFRAFFSSCYLGVSKPTPAIDQRALDITQCPPECCVFVDDRSLNLEMAAQLGMHTILCKDGPQLAEDLQKQGVVIGMA